MHLLTFWVQPPMRFRIGFFKKSCQLGLSGEKVWTIRGKLCGEILHWNVFSLHMNARAEPWRVGERRNFPQGPQCFGSAFLETLIRVLVPPPAPKVRSGALKSANSRSFCCHKEEKSHVLCETVPSRKRTDRRNVKKSSKMHFSDLGCGIFALFLRGVLGRAGPRTHMSV